MNRRGAAYVVLAVAVVLFAVGSERVLRAADPEKGKAAFEKCAACHSLDGTEADGPTLKDVLGRKAGSLEDYRYSVAMKRSGITWDAATLDAYIADPQAAIPGNRMSFAGISDKDERDDLIAYLLAAAGREGR